MLGVGGAAAITAKKERPTGAHRVFDQPERDVELWSELGGDTSGE
jgi:hypothetical protein